MIHRKQQLQEQVKEDPYDPMIPNDLLHYWEYKSMVQQRQEFEREKLETIQQQEALREQLKQEREQLVLLAQKQQQQQQDDDEQGIDKCDRVDADRAIQEYEQRRAQSLGRGRGVSNLPAWMVQKQKKETEQASEFGNTYQ
jgi:hypothetical protein